MSEVKLPELGENIEKGDVVRVLVKVGDVIAADQPIAELETDKATIEVPSPEAGAVAEIRIKPGDKVKVGQVLLVLTESRQVKTRASDAGDVKASAPAPASPPAAQPAPQAAPAQAAPPPAAPAAAASPAAAAAAPPARPAAAVVDIATG
ncbi:MAG TPA: biotin/lipoyl-containing protein, partial [Vicinamibacterales bacterium]|nr:biotin/lipoyl-containing protein [Vicinamibacterales bacterium]